MLSGSIRERERQERVAYRIFAIGPECVKTRVSAWTDKRRRRLSVQPAQGDVFRQSGPGAEVRARGLIQRDSVSIFHANQCHPKCRWSQFIGVNVARGNQAFEQIGSVLLRQMKLLDNEIYNERVGVKSWLPRRQGRMTFLSH